MAAGWKPHPPGLIVPRHRGEPDDRFCRLVGLDDGLWLVSGGPQVTFLTGTQTWIPPLLKATYYLLLIGGGASGAGGVKGETGDGGGGGGSGEVLPLVMAISGPVHIVVGTGGAAVAGTTNGYDGGNTTATIAGTIYTAKGGTCGRHSGNGAATPGTGQGAGILPSWALRFVRPGLGGSSRQSDPYGDGGTNGGDGQPGQNGNRGGGGNGFSGGGCGGPWFSAQWGQPYPTPYGGGGGGGILLTYPSAPVSVTATNSLDGVAPGEGFGAGSTGGANSYGQPWQSWDGNGGSSGRAADGGVLIVWNL